LAIDCRVPADTRFSCIIPQNHHIGNLPTDFILFYNEGITYNHNYEEVSMRRAFSFLIGTLMGGIVGACAALLFAPMSGKNLRVQITQRAQGFTADIRQAATTKRIELQDRLETLRAPRP
jgi:hypothetical protein